MIRRLLPVTLTARLVATAVALVAVVGLLVSGATAVVMGGYLGSRLDTEVAQALHRERGRDGDIRNFCPTDSPNLPGGLPPGQGAGTLTVRVGCAFVLTTDGTARQLSTDTLKALSTVPVDGEPHTIDLPELGRYRVAATSSAVTGLPTSDVDDATRQLLLSELVLTLAGVVVAAGAGTWLVRRQLRPLRAVADTAHAVTQQHLASGEPDLSTRVAPDLTDPATEVGQVGAALNTLLDHVDGALVARHASEQQLRRFLADASHELRTPLTTIHGYAELSRRTPEDAATLSSSMARVGTEATRMSALVEDMLLLARLDSGRPLERRPVDLTRLLLEAVADARVVDQAHHWRLALPDEPVEISGDEQRLHQVVTNLLNNARAHTPDGTTVTVGLAAREDGARISVHDDGPGLPPDLVDRAFERFSRGDSSRTRASGGAGLGLSLVQAIVAAHRGSVRVDSRPGSTTFTVVLPTR